MFRYQNFSERLKGSFTKFYGTVRQKVFDGKCWYPPLLSLTFLDNLNFWNTERLPHEVFWHCETKIFRRKTVMLPPSTPLLSIKFFDTRNFPKHRKVVLRNVLILWDRTISTENSDTRPRLLSPAFFDTRYFLKQRKVPFRIFSVLRDNEFSTENRSTLLNKIQKSVVELILVKNLSNYFLKSVFVSNRLEKLIKKFVIGWKICRCLPAVLFTFFSIPVNIF